MSEMRRVTTATNCLDGYDWEPIASAMMQAAEAAGDGFLEVVAAVAYGTAITHSAGQQGCSSCCGVAVELCNEWTDQQKIMLAWVKQRAGVV